MKVNHAGETGAVSIYAGQILVARLTAPSLLLELVEFKSHEEKHRAIFYSELQRRGLRRCRSYWLCAIGGYALGIVTGLFGHRAIAATTFAVEGVVLRHLTQQLCTLAGNDNAAADAISKIVAEEQEHQEQSASHITGSSFWRMVLIPIVAFATESVIWLGMRL